MDNALPFVANIKKPDTVALSIFSQHFHLPTSNRV
jgi:hypothetical protein